MKIVLDTNVFISGVFWKGTPAKILSAWQDNKIQLVTTASILEEYQRVIEILSKKYTAIDVPEILELVNTYSHIAGDIILPHPISPDPDDDKFIACAIASNTKIIVSGDSDLLTISGYARIKVLKPKAFIDLYLG